VDRGRGVELALQHRPGVVDQLLGRAVVRVGGGDQVRHVVHDLPQLRTGPVEADPRFPDRGLETLRRHRVQQVLQVVEHRRDLLGNGGLGQRQDRAVGEDRAARSVGGLRLEVDVLLTDRRDAVDRGDRVGRDVEVVVHPHGDVDALLPRGRELQVGHLADRVAPVGHARVLVEVRSLGEAGGDVLLAEAHELGHLRVDEHDGADRQDRDHRQDDQLVAYEPREHQFPPR
jgi:hypothetical protein